MPPYPDEGGKASSPSCEPLPALQSTHVNPPAPVKVEPLAQPVLQAALSLAAPYYSGDSDSDDHIPAAPTTAPGQAQAVKEMQTLAPDIAGPHDEAKHANGDAIASPTSAPQPVTAVLPNDNKETAGARNLKNASASEDNSPPDSATGASAGTLPTESKPLEGNPVVKTENLVASESKSLSPDCVTPANSKEVTPSDTAEGAADSVVVSKNCVNDIMDMLSNRITELEQIRERKRARVEQLSSAALIAQSSAMAIWPPNAGGLGGQTAGMPPGAIGLMPGTVPAPASRPGTPFLPVAEHPTLAGALPPPPPPPPDGSDRKQSRYWTADEHQRFLAAIKTCGPKNYVQIAEIVGTRNAKQVRTHAQKFQKKLEREEAKRREDLERHGGPTVSAAAVAAVAAAAAAMHRGGGSVRHLTTDNSADRGFAQPLLPYAGIDPTRGVFRAQFLGAPGANLGDSVDGSSSTNDVSGQHQLAFTVPHAPGQAAPTGPNAAMAAIAAEAAALGGRVFGGGAAGSGGQTAARAGPSGVQQTEAGAAVGVPLKRAAAAASGSGSGGADAAEPTAKKCRNHTAMTENQIGASQVQVRAAGGDPKGGEIKLEAEGSGGRKGDEVSVKSNTEPAVAQREAKVGGAVADGRKSGEQVTGDDKAERPRSCDGFSDTAGEKVAGAGKGAKAADVADGAKKKGAQTGIVAAVSELAVSEDKKGGEAVTKEPETSTAKAAKK